MTLIGRIKLLKVILPMEIKIKYSNDWGVNPPEYYDKLPDVERIDGRTLRKMSGSQDDIFIR